MGIRIVSPPNTSNPVFPTSVTTPLVVGGTGVGSTLTLKSTSGVGSTDAIIFQVGNNGATEAGRIDTSGLMGIGTTTPNPTIQSSVAPRVVIAGSGLAGFAAVVRHTSLGAGAGFLVMNTRGTSVTDYTTVQNGDGLGQFSFYGADGNDYIIGASVRAVASDVVSNGVLPADLQFITNNASGTSVEQMRITKTGSIRALVGVFDTVTGGSTSISSGTGTVKMTSTNNANNAAWIPLAYNGTTYYVPAWTTHAP